MRLPLLTFLFTILSLTTINGQIENGSIAPDFELTDINGETHHLYEYLDQGKFVFLDVFATWCTTCWNQIPNVDAVYEEFGPEGQDNMVFLALETDDQTLDTMQHPWGTAGDWLNAIPYPIINTTGTFESDYELFFQPAFFVIRPDYQAYFILPPSVGGVQVIMNGYVVQGCTNPEADNYNEDATEDDGTCIISGCTNPMADNYEQGANQDDGSCIISGCTIPSADNYNPEANNNDGSCIITGCTDEDADNYNWQANNEDGSCIFSGCTNSLATNYDPEANNDNGTCTFASDFDGNGIVNSADLLEFLAQYGCSEDCGSADFDGDGVVGGSDLLFFLSTLGS